MDVPLAATFMLSTKTGKEAYVEPVIEDRGYRFTVKVGVPPDADAVQAGTKLSRGANFRCVMSGSPVTGDYIKAEGQAKRMSERLMAVVAEGDRGRVYLTPTPEQEAAARKAIPEWKPDVEFFQQALGFRVGNYGMSMWGDLFTPRQLVALTTFCDLVGEATERIRHDAAAKGLPDDGQPLHDGGTGATAYAEAVTVYLACVVDYAANYWSVIATPADGFIRGTFARQALPMTWDYAEAPPFGHTSGNWLGGVKWISKALNLLPWTRADQEGSGVQADAARQALALNAVVSIDPPYYDNIGYADLSDFFHVWLRRSLKPVFPELFATLAVPKTEELVATPYRHGGKVAAEAFFLNGMTQAVRRLAEQAHPGFPVTIYYAFKQSETRGDSGTASTGWETFLDALLAARGRSLFAELACSGSLAMSD